jgi:tetratricopeptide (TPR) repeat protein
MRSLIALSLLLIAPVTVATAGDDAPATPTAPVASLAKPSLPPQVLYQFMLGEIAGARGNLPVALAAYMEMARSTHNPRIAQRAAEIAFHARQLGASIEAAQIWVAAEPESVQANQTLAGLYGAANRDEEMGQQLTKLLALDKEQVGASLLMLNRTLGRNADKKAVRRQVDAITAPYIGIAEAHFARAQAAYNADDSAAALTEIEKALTLRPDWEYAAMFLARLRPDEGGRVADLLARFVRNNPTSPDARLGLARALVAAKRYPEARTEFLALLETNSSNPDLLYAVGILSLQLKEPKKAETYFSQALEAGYKDPDLVRYYLGQIAEEDGRTEQALKYYAVTGGEQQMPALARAVSLLVKQGKIDDARHWMHEIKLADPKDHLSLLLVEAQLLREAGRAEDAYALLEKELVAQPDNPELLYETGMLAERVGRLDVAERHWRKLVALKPDHAQAYNALGYSLADRGERLDEALSLIDKALTLLPGDPFILDSKGWVLFRRGDAQGALDALNKAFAGRPDPEIAAHLGEVLWSLGRRDEAERTLREASKGSPNNEVLSATIKRLKP